MLYMVTFTINIPPMLAYIPYMDPMGRGPHIEVTFSAILPWAEDRPRVGSRPGSLTRGRIVGIRWCHRQRVWVSHGLSMILYIYILNTHMFYIYIIYIGIGMGQYDSPKWVNYHPNRDYSGARDLTHSWRIPRATKWSTNLHKSVCIYYSRWDTLIKQKEIHC